MTNQAEEEGKKVSEHGWQDDMWAICGLECSTQLFGRKKEADKNACGPEAQNKQD